MWQLSAHCGPTNARIRVHLGLLCPPGARLRVGGETRAWREGEVLVFDDSFDHDVVHDGTERRIVTRTHARTHARARAHTHTHTARAGRGERNGVGCMTAARRGTRTGWVGWGAGDMTAPKLHTSATKPWPSADASSGAL